MIRFYKSLNPYFVVAALVGLSILAAILTSCGSMSYVKVGEPCDIVGSEARGKGGAYYQCKADPDGGPNRWRRA